MLTRSAEHYRKNIRADFMLITCCNLVHGARNWSVLRRLRNPSAAHHQIAVVKHDSLARSDGALRLVEGHSHFAVRSRLQHRGRGLMAMADLGSDSHQRVGVSAGIV